MGSQFSAASVVNAWTSVSTAVVLVLAPVASAAPAPASASAESTTADEPAALPTTKERVARGLEYYEAGNFDRAIEEFQVAYAASASPTILFPWAQAERRRGNCREAIALYQRFIDAGPPPKQVEAATMNRDECQARLQSTESVAASIVPGETGEVAAPDPPPEPEREPPPEEPPPPPRPRPDVLGWSLLGIGAGVAIAGGGLLGAAAGSESRATDAGTYGEFGDLKRVAASERIAGAVVTGIGLALLVGGIVRLSVTARKRSQLRAWVDPRGGLGVGGRF